MVIDRFEVHVDKLLDERINCVYEMSMCKIEECV